MSEPTAAFLSYRLGGADGVSIEARKWEWALHTLGFATRRIAGELDDGLRPDDTWLAFLAIDPVRGSRVDDGALDAALAHADLVVVENVCSLPLNLDAARAAGRALRRCSARVVLHHHDLPWERQHLAAFGAEFPPELADALHVTISRQAAEQLRLRRGTHARTIPNAFDPDPEPGDRQGTRLACGFGPTDLVVLHPTRAIARKDVPAALELCGRLRAEIPHRTVRYWLTGPAEDGYGRALEQLLAASPVCVHRGSVARIADAYAAADLVVYPSTWEGFGNPVVEATLARRPLVTGWYPVLDEIVAMGAEPFGLDQVDEIVAFLHSSGDERLERAARKLGAALSLERLPAQLSEAFASRDWTEW